MVALALGYAVTAAEAREHLKGSAAAKGAADIPPTDDRFREILAIIRSRLVTSTQAPVQISSRCKPLYSSIFIDQPDMQHLNLGATR